MPSPVLLLLLQLMPMLLRALRVDDLTLQRVTLETLGAHAQDAAPALAAHINSLVSAALALATRVSPRTGVRSSVQTPYRGVTLMC